MGETQPKNGTQPKKVEAQSASKGNVEKSIEIFEQASTDIQKEVTKNQNGGGKKNVFAAEF